MVNVSSSATGGLLTGVTVPVTEPISSPPLPSSTTYLKVIGPL